MSTPLLSFLHQTPSMQRLGYLFKTRPPATMHPVLTAIHPVLTTYELPEQILAQVDSFRDIERLRRVCRYWEAVIRKSPVVRAACWYPTSRDGREGEARGDPYHISNPGRCPYKLNLVFDFLGLPILCYLSNHRMGEVQSESPPLREARTVDLDARDGSSDPRRSESSPTNLNSDLSATALVPREGPLLVGHVVAVLAGCQRWPEAGLEMRQLAYLSGPYDPYYQLHLRLNLKETTVLDSPPGFENRPSSPPAGSESAAGPPYEITLVWPETQMAREWDSLFLLRLRTDRASGSSYREGLRRIRDELTWRLKSTGEDALISFRRRSRKSLLVAKWRFRLLLGRDCR